ncbi:MAG: 5'/3'-nucleotidase SurE [Sedimentisphaerales bacterium]|nr:5'/3'-nucleotidase SurE [Sedimentisphaerales bacterium]
MNILLTNDDGIFAPGLSAIYKELITLGSVSVVAPDASRSGTSHSITFNRPIVCNKVDVNGLFTGYSIEGSPADCVKLAVMQLCEEPFDVLVAGINNGANTGINVYYSGTVAAAMEGVLLGIPSVAMSVAAEEQMDYTAAAKYCVQILKQLLPVEQGAVVNINIPLLSQGSPRGIKVVPQSNRAFDEYYEPQKDENGQTVYQLAGGPHPFDDAQTDTVALIEGFISVTALAPDMTDYKRTKRLRKKLGRIGLQGEKRAS